MNAKLAQAIVRAAYPKAECQPIAPTKQLGQAAPYQDGAWQVQAGGDLGSIDLGAGLTEEAAWIAAAAEVNKAEERARSDGYIAYLTSKKGFVPDATKPDTYVDPTNPDNIAFIVKDGTFRGAGSVPAMLEEFMKQS